MSTAQLITTPFGFESTAAEADARTPARPAHLTVGLQESRQIADLSYERPRDRS
jgi:hypothetical protein